VLRRARLVVLAAVLSSPVQAEAASCRGYPESVRAEVKRSIEAVQRLEREAADRIKGLDTRPFAYLATQARAAADAIADQRVLDAEQELSRCRNSVSPVRTICRGAALALAQAIDEQAAGSASKSAKQAYAGAMPTCERWVGLPSLKSAFRAID
jgi:hypothetical protein